MRFSFFAVLSGLAALAVVDALPAENLEHSIRSLVTCDHDQDCKSDFHVNKQCTLTVVTGTQQCPSGVWIPCCKSY